MTYFSAVGLFLVSHGWLAGLFVCTLVLSLVYERWLQQQGIPALTPSELTAWVNRQEAVLLDVREAEAFKRGAIAGAVHVSMQAQTAGSRLRERLKIQERPVIVVGGVDQAPAERLAQALKAEGCVRTAVLAGGMPAWVQEQLPVVSTGGK